MRSCCSTEAIAGQFDRKEADDELRRYRRNGPTTSARKARRIYGAVFPRDRVLVRLAVLIENLVKRIRGSAFRSYLHPPAVIDELLRQAGFSRHRTQRTWSWEIVVYARTASR